MARSAAAKKVAKAASTGAGGKGAASERKVLFPAAMTLVALLGVVLVLVARDQRADLAPVGDPGLEDHWHSAYNFFVCDEVDPTVFENDSEDDRTGIHTHGDGLIHIHPFVSTVTGQYATLGAFFDENETAFDDDEVELPSGPLLEESSFSCGDGNAEIRVLKWNQLTAEKPVVYTEDLRDVRLNEDGQLLMFAIVDESYDSADIPRPDDSYLRQYLGLSAEQRPLSEDDGLGSFPILPESGEPFETEEPAPGAPVSGEPSDG